MNRYCFVQSSEACALFGDTPIIEQMLDNNVDIMLGGGTNLLPEAETGGKTVHEKATALGYTVVTDREALMKLSPNTKTLGVFSNGHMPPEWQGKDGQSGDVIKFNDDRTAILYSELEACEANPEHMGMPRLEEMSKYAIENLKNSEDGFFLMIEGALIDKQAHIAKPCGTIGDMLAFDRTVKMAVEYAKEIGDTAVIVTADHGQATQVIFNVESFYPPLAFEHVKGLYQRLLTKGGNEITAYYGTNNVGDQSHTAVNVPIYTYGLDDSENLTGVIQQTEIYGVMKDFLFN
jgi:alkaline phosphatase